MYGAIRQCRDCYFEHKAYRLNPEACNACYRGETLCKGYSGCEEPSLAGSLIQLKIIDSKFDDLARNCGFYDEVNYANYQISQSISLADQGSRAPSLECSIFSLIINLDDKLNTLCYPCYQQRPCICCLHRGSLCLDGIPCRACRLRNCRCRRELSCGKK